MNNTVVDYKAEVVVWSISENKVVSDAEVTTVIESDSGFITARLGGYKYTVWSITPDMDLDVSDYFNLVIFTK